MFMKKHFKRLLIFLTALTLLFSLCACDPAEEIDNFMNSLFGDDDGGGSGISKPNFSPQKNEDEKENNGNIYQHVFRGGKGGEY